MTRLCRALIVFGIATVFSPAIAAKQTPAQAQGQTPTQTQAPAQSPAQVPTPPVRQARPPARPAPPAVTDPAEVLAETQRRELQRQRWNSRPVFRLGQDYTLRSDDVARHIAVVSGNITVEGHVFEDVVVVLGDVHLASTAVIEGSVVAVAGTVTVDNGASIHQDLVAVGGTLDSPASFSPSGEQVVIGIPLLGDHMRSVVPWITRGLLWGRLIVPDLRWVWMTVLLFFAVSLVINLVLDRPVQACATVLAERPLGAFLAGLIVLMLFAPLLVILAATVVGIAVIPFFVFAVVVAWMIGKIGVVRSLGAGAMGQGQAGSRAHGTFSFLIGFAAITLAYMVPVLGIAAWAMVGVFGLGAATLTFLAGLRRESPKKATPPSGPSTPEPSSPPPMPPSPDAFVPNAPMAASAFDASGPAAFQSTEPTGHAPPMPGVSAAAATAGQTTAAAGRNYATFLDRVAAFALDCILVAIANNLLDFTRRGSPFFLLLLLYHVAFWAWMGTTMGGIVVGIRVVRTDGDRLRVVDALVRGLGSLFSFAALGIGCFWMLQDPERQMWHDKIAGTYVVKVPRNVLLDGVR